MGDKLLKGTKETDPEWIIEAANHAKSLVSEEYRKQLRELFLEYVRDGLDSKTAWKKACKVISSFRYKK
jgi:hypothetical protein